jgi:hypothetical protein
MLLCLIDVRSNEFYIIIFLNKLKIVESTKKNKNKTSMAKDMGPFRDSQALSWLSGPQTDVPAKPRPLS